VGEKPVATDGRPMQETSTSTTTAAAPNRRLRRNRVGWTCPDCGLVTRDQVSIRLGFCSRCSDFTGMCAAGRKIICPDMMTVTAWHTPCTSRGIVLWQITQGARQQRALLCPAHDEQLRVGRASWISQAMRVQKTERG
jgi:predicted RNA-binding Zn-ribbon protein involved in translation (DUF1610 family)